MIRRLMMLAALGLVIAGPVRADDVEDRVAASRATVKQFFETLKGELTKALDNGGPRMAIAVCNAKAANIAESISTEKGWRVARTSLKLRNPGNAPDEWEAAVLHKFEQRKAAGENPATMEFHEAVEKDGKKVFRYMKAIPTAEQPCLMCHGENLTDEVKEALAENYPSDEATGFKTGDIRGAFTIEQPME